MNCVIKKRDYPSNKEQFWWICNRRICLFSI